MLHSHRGRFVQQIQEALDMGEVGWTKQAEELHTFRADQENLLKEGKGFYKLNEDNITAVCKELVVDYKTLVDHHSKEVVHYWRSMALSN